MDRHGVWQVPEGRREQWKIESWLGGYLWCFNGPCGLIDWCWWTTSLPEYFSTPLSLYFIPYYCIYYLSTSIPNFHAFVRFCTILSSESFFCLTMLLENFDFHIVGYWTSSIWPLWHLFLLEETHRHHMGYCFWQAARDLLYALSHGQDRTYHSLWWTNCGPLVGMENSPNCKWFHYAGSIRHAGGSKPLQLSAALLPELRPGPDFVLNHCTTSTSKQTALYVNTLVSIYYCTSVPQYLSSSIPQYCYIPVDMHL